MNLGGRMALNFPVHEFYQDLINKGIIFCFSGPVSQEVIEGIGGTLKQKMELQEAGMSTTQKVFAVFVEQMQNIVNYSADRIAQDDIVEHDIRLGVLIIGRERDHYYIVCGNKVRAEDVPVIREQLETVSRLTKEELKQLFKDRRKSPANSSKGAGLGFIEIARKATRPITFDFTEIGGGHVFFSITAFI
jgi:hypothetical protein